MLKQNLLFSFIFLFLLTNCKSPSTTQVQNKTPQPMCIALYNPVCGKNGKTYSNSCNADVAGVEYTQGECKPKK